MQRMNTQNKYDNKKDLMISVDTAYKLLMKYAPVAKKSEFVNLTQATDRIIAETIKSKIDVPEHNNSAVDGYGFNFKDKFKHQRLKIVGESSPGKPFLGKISSGQAIKVYTGALIIGNKNDLIPIDTIVMQEEVSNVERSIELKEKIKAGQNIRLKGEDIIKEQVIFKKGKKIRSLDLGYLASVGIERVRVFKKLKVGIFSSGNEINTSSKHKKYMIFDSNKISLISLFNKIGCESYDCGIIKDNYNISRKKIKEMSKKFDILVTTGGISSSDTDAIKKVVRDIGDMKFSKISLKPGRPFTFALINNIPFLGLPGNPVAVVVVFLYFIADFIAKIYNVKRNIKSIKVKSNFNFKKKANRRELLRGFLLEKQDQLLVERFPSEGSGILSSVAKSEGLIELMDNESTIKKGSYLKFYPFESLLK